MKLCSACKETKNLNEFAKKKAGHQPICRACRKVWFKAHYENNKAYYVDRAKKQEAVLRQWFRDFKKTLSCEQCGENDSRCLDFHHNDPTEKDFAVSTAIKFNRARLMAEIAKCTVLCSNCHRKHHKPVA